VKVLARLDDLTFHRFTEASQIDELTIEGFSFFHSFGIVDYKRTFMAWLRKFPRPIFIGVTDEHKRLMGWNYVDEWNEEKAKDGFAVHIVRAIEVHPNLKKKNIGSRLLLCGFKNCPGHVMTKPVSDGADGFFRAIGFKGPEEIATKVVAVPNNHLFMHTFKRLSFIESHADWMEQQKRRRPRDTGRFTKGF